MERSMTLYYFSFIHQSIGMLRQHPVVKTQITALSNLFTIYIKYYGNLQVLPKHTQWMGTILNTLKERF